MHFITDICNLCGVQMDDPWDYIEINSKRIQSCSYCGKVVKKFDGISPIPLELSPGSYRFNNGATFGKRFEDKDVKVRMLYKFEKILHASENFKGKIQNDNYFRNATNRFRELKTINFIHNNYDKIIRSINDVYYISYQDVKDLLSEHFKLKEIDWECHNCHNKFTHIDKIHDIKRENQKPIFLINKETNKIQTYCRECCRLDNDFIHSRTVETVLPLICFESIDEFKKLL